MFQYDGKPVKKWSLDLASGATKPYMLLINTTAITGSAIPRYRPPAPSSSSIGRNTKVR